MAAVFIYGAVRYHDAPLRECTEHGYCGKWGRPHTADEYHAFIIWQTTLIVTWPIGILVLLCLAWGWTSSQNNPEL